jgi:hypothetical protein
MGCLGTSLFVSCNDYESAITEIQMYSLPQTMYYEGEDFKLLDATILVKYDDGNEEYVKITEGMLSAFDKNLIGEQGIRVSYKGASTNFLVRVRSLKVSDVDLVRTADFQWEYVEGQLFNTNGLYLRLNYIDEAQPTEVPVTSSMVTGFNQYVTGSQTVNIIYEHTDGTVISASIEVTVKPKELHSITIKILPLKLQYFQYDTLLDLTGGQVLLQYNNNYAEEVYLNSLAGLETTWSTNEITENTPVKLTFGGKTAQYDIKVIEEDVVSASVLTMPNINQLVGAPLNLAGITYRLSITDSSTRTIPFTASNILIDGEEELPSVNYVVKVFGYNKNYVGAQTINLQFSSGGKWLKTLVPLEVSVRDKSIESIEIYRTSEFDDDGNPIDESIVYTKTPFMPYGVWTYVLVFDNGEITEPAPLTYTILKNTTSADSLLYDTAGSINWALIYSDGTYFREDNYTFDVIALEITQAKGFYTKVNNEYMPLDILTVQFGILVSEISLNNVYALIEYNSGDEAYISLAGVSLHDDSINTSDLSATTASLTISDSYSNTNIDASINVKVVNYVQNFTISSLPSKLEYKKYNPIDTPNAASYILDLTGLALSVTYLSGNVSTVSSFNSGEWAFECDDWTSADNYFKFTTISDATTIYIYNLSVPELKREFTVKVRNDIASISIMQTEDDIFATIYVGANIDLTGKYINVAYENFEVEKVYLTHEMVEYDYTKHTKPEPKLAVPISYKGEQITGYVSIIDNQIKDISVLSSPNKIVYATNSEFDVTGLVVSLNYQNGTSRLLTLEEFNLQNNNTTAINPAQPDFPDDLNARKVNVIYTTFPIGTYQTYFKIYIVEKAASSMRWKDNTVPTVVAKEGHEFNIAEYAALQNKIVVMSYNDGTSNEFSLNSISPLIVVGYNRNAKVTQVVQLTYSSGCYLNINVQMQIRNLSYISILPLNITVVENAEIDLTQLQLQLSFNDGTKALAPVLAENIYYSASNPDGYNMENAVVGDKSYTVSYTYNGDTKICSLSIRVIEKTLVNIAIGVMPKNKYIEGEDFTTMSQDGQLNGTLILTYNNGRREIKNLSDANQDYQVGFFINRIKFNSDEFTGIPKRQTIYIGYDWQGTKFTTEYDIIMNDRRDPVVEYTKLSDADITYFEYGSFSDENGQFVKEDMPSARIGYYAVYAGDYPTYIGNYDTKPANVTFHIHYVRIEDYASYVADNNKGDKYDFARYAGDYYLILYYSGDAFNNEYTTNNTNSKRITITKKAIYVVVDSKTRTYGDPNNPNNINTYYIHFYNSIDGGVDTSTTGFAYKDTYNSADFAVQSTSGSTCYYDGNLISYISIDTLNVTMQSVVMSVYTGVGEYSIRMSGIVSSNYQINYAHSGDYAAKFTINKREVLITPKSMSIVYGTMAADYTIDYTTSGTGNDAISGIVNNDTLAGKLELRNATDIATRNVGYHTIVLGTLNNANYQLKLPYLPNESNSDQNKHVYVQITVRDIYLQVSNATSIFGSSVDTATIVYGFYADSGATNSNAFAYPDESISNLGAINIYFSLSSDTSESIEPAQQHIGTYKIVANVTETASSTIYNNYNIIYRHGDLEITPKPITITVNPVSKTYGDEDPEIKAVYDINELVTFGTTLIGAPQRDSGENVGNYLINITAMQEAAENADYRLTLASTVYFTINQKILTIKFKNPDTDGQYFTSNIYQRVYDGRYPALQAQHYDLFDASDEIDTKYDKSLIELTFDYMSSSAGDYEILLNAYNANYKIVFLVTGRNIYRITPATLYADDFMLTADGVEMIADEQTGAFNLSYNGGSEYVVGVVVREESKKVLYDANGNPVKDNLERPVRDTISVIPGSSRVSYSGSYSITITGITNANYVVQSGIVKQYNITKKVLSVELLNTTYDADIDKWVQTRYYNAAPITLYRGANDDYVVKDGDKVVDIDVRLGFDTYSAPIDVLYDIDNNILGYNVIIQEFTTISDRDNYIVEFSNNASYIVKVVKRPISVTLFESNLFKVYNHTAPSITRSMAELSDTSTNFDFNKLQFTYIRNDEAYRANYEVGWYSIVLTCDDPNHIVTLTSDYLYEIRQASITVDLKTSQLNSTYTGVAFYATSDMLSYRSTIVNAITPVVRTIYDTSQITNAKAVFTSALTKAIDIKTSAQAISADNAIVAQVSLNNLLSKVNDLSNYLTNTLSSYMTFETTTVTEISNYLNAVTQYINTAISNPDNMTLSALRLQTNLLYDSVNKTNSYIYFIVNGAAEDVGDYAITFDTNDFNRKFTVNVVAASLPIVRISPTVIKLTVKNGESIYGVGTLDDVLSSIEYSATLYDQDLELSEFANYVDLKLALNTSETWPYPANDQYLITAQITVKNSNYTVAPIESAYYKIARRNIYVHWQTTTSLTYGDTVRKTILNVVYDANNSENIGQSVGLLDADKNAKITYKTQNIIGYKVVGSSYQLVDTFFGSNTNSAGVYLVVDSGSTFQFSTNYIVNVLDPRNTPDYAKTDIITINKAEIDIATSAGNAISRIYGDKLSLSYIGFVNGETAEGILGANFLPGFQEGETYATNTTLGITTTDPYTIKFNNVDIVYANYAFKDISNIEYKLSINQSPLSIKLAANENDAINNAVFKAEYAATLTLNTDYILYMTGWKNDDVSTLKDAIEQVTTIDFNKVVASKEPLGSGRILIDRAKLGNDDFALFSNYGVTIETTEYEVLPKEIKIGLNKDLHVLKGTVIEPYKIAVEMNATPVYDETDTSLVIGATYYITSVALHSGAFSEYDIIIEGLVDGDTITSIFKTLSTQIVFSATSANVPAQTTYITSADGKLIKCEATYNSSYIGTQTAKLSGVEFVLSTPNYKITYLPFNLTIYDKVSDIVTSLATIYLEDDIIESSNIPFQITYANNTTTIKNTYENNNSKLAINGTLPSETNKTSILGVEYSMLATLSHSDFISQFPNLTWTLYEDDGPKQYNITTESTTFSDSYNGNLAIRIYPKQTTVVTTNLDLYNESSQYAFGSKIDSVNTELSYLYKNNESNDWVGSFTRLDTSIRLIPNYSNNFAYNLYLYSNSNESEYIYLNFTSSGVRVVGNNSSTSFFSMPLDIFDGFTHNIKVYFDKQNMTIQVILDDNYVTLSNSINISVSEFSITDIENSTIKFSVSYADAWVRHFEVALQGYADNYASLALPSETSKIFYLSSDSTSDSNNVGVNLRSLFKTSSRLDYVFTYYVDGLLIQDMYVGSYQLKLGSHVIRQVISQNTVVFDSATINVYVTYSGNATINGGSGTTQLSNVRPTPSSPAVAYGYTPNISDNNVYANTSLARNIFEVKHANDLARYSKITTEFSIKRANSSSEDSSSYRDSNVSSNYIILATSDTKTAFDTTSTPTTNNYYGFAISIIYSDSNTITSNFHIMYNRNGTGSHYYDSSILDQVTWDSSKTYIVEFTLNYVTDAINNATATLIIYESGTSTPLVNCLIDSTKTFANKAGSLGNETISQSDLLWISSLTGNQSDGRMAGFSMSDAKATIRRITFGEPVYGHDLLINNNYVQKIDSGIEISNSDTVTLSNFNSTTYIGRLGVIGLTFKSIASSDNTKLTLKFVSNTKGTEYYVKMEYDDSTKEILFSFGVNNFNGYTFQSAGQKVTSAIDLFDDNTHTIIFDLRRDPITSNSTISGKMVPQTADAVSYNRAYVTIDGTQYGLGAVADTGLIVPSALDFRHWIDSNGNVGTSSSGSNIQGTGSFMPPYLSVDLSATIKVYELEIGTRNVYTENME